MPTKNSLKIAEYLLQIKAVRLNLDEPFQWSSGWKSPIYCDNRLILSYPDIRRDVRDAFVEKIRSGYAGVEVIAGVATGGIALGALVAEVLNLPFVYIRSASKGHGMKNLIEGKLETGQKCVLIEDLISTGGSSAKAVKAVQAAGGDVLGTLAIFQYGFQKAQETFAQTHTSFQTLTNLAALLEKAQDMQYIRSAELQRVLDWQKSPETWG